MIECIFIGDELLDGRILNRNQQTIAQDLGIHGFYIQQATCVTDDFASLKQFFKSAVSRSNVILTTGGLGPTEDDRTTEALCDALSTSSILNEHELQKLKDYYSSRHRPFLDINTKQAYFPKDAIVLDNPHGTAPGFALNHHDTWIFVMPGVPLEMKSMLANHVIPLLNKHCLAEKKHVKSALFKCINASESEHAQRLADLYPLPKGFSITYQLKFPELHIRLNSSNKSQTSLFDSIEKKIANLLADTCFTNDINITFLDYVVHYLKEKKMKVSFVESCTGGLLSSLITSLPGASDIFDFGIVSYSNHSKHQLLGISNESLKHYGAVSGHIAELMAKNGLNQSQADICISITGIAGPSGGRSEKPVGTVFFGIATPTRCHVIKDFIPTERQLFQKRVAYKALSLLLQK